MTNSVLKNRTYILLIILLLASSVLRFYQIDQVSISLFWNETFMKMLSVLFGILTILATYLLVNELIRKHIFDIDSKNIGLLTALMVAVSPWHIHFSRVGYEVNVGLFFVVFGAFLFFRFINSNNYNYIFLSMVFYAASIYFYGSIWIFVPLFILSLFSIYYKQLFSKENIKRTLLSIGLSFLIILPFISSGGVERSSRMVFTGSLYEEVLEFEANKQNSEKNTYLLEVSKNYLIHFSPNFLFFEGDGNNRYGARNTGVLYIWGIFFIIPGILVLTKLDKKVAMSLLAWLIIAPIPAALSILTPHVLQSINMIPIPQLLISFGLIWFLYLFSKKHRVAVSAILIGIGLYFMIDFFTLYFG